ncbi:STAS domain-containing protein [candidate division FCPU426 bacterium]|nr:STAS domain-containing protein [candidate division FCPU426 bacterium]
MTIRLFNEDDVAVISLINDIDMQEVVNIRNTIAQIICSGCHQLVLDLSRVQHINATGIGILAESLRRIRQLQGDLKLAGLNPQLRNVFALTGMDKFFHIYHNRHAAVQSFKKEKCVAA